MVIMAIELCLKAIFCCKLIKIAPDKTKLSNASKPPDSRMAEDCALIDAAAFFLHMQMTTDRRRMLKMI